MTPAPMTRTPIPEGTVSTIRGHWQAPVLRGATQAVLALSVAASVVAGPLRDALAGTAIGLIIAAPLVRLCWLMHRWRQEHDRRFVLAGLGVLAIVTAGAALAATGLGR